MDSNFGFVRVAAAVPTMRVADCRYNAEQIRLQIDEAIEEGVDVICFPELSITGYTCADLFFTQTLQQIAQKTEDKVGPYELHDFFLYYFMRFGFTREKIKYMACQAFEDQYDEATIEKWLNMFMRRFCTQQFKRSAMPDGPKVVGVSLSPRGDWRMPSDACCI